MVYVEYIVVDRRWPTEVLLVLRRHLACPTRDQSRSWLQTIERGLSQALKRYSLTTRGPKNRILVDLKQDSRGPKTGFHAFGMYIHNDTLLALGRESDQFGDTGIPFRPVIGLPLTGLTDFESINLDGPGQRSCDGPGRGGTMCT